MSTPNEQRLDDLGDEIDDAREQAQRDRLLEDPHHERRFVDSGDREATEEDDQTIAPPG